MYICVYVYIYSAHCDRSFHILEFNQLWIKYILKNPESDKRRNLNLFHTSNNLHSIYIVLGIINNLELIYSIQEDVHIFIFLILLKYSWFTMLC